jgi:hypothetical protein
MVEQAAKAKRIASIKWRTKTQFFFFFLSFFLLPPPPPPPSPQTDAQTEDYKAAIT